MGKLLAGLLAGALISSSAFALGDLASFERIQDECVPAGGLTFGPQGRWANCQVSKGRWYSTIGNTDLYQAQYCLGQAGAACEQRALLLFANRAYTPVAKLQLARVDPADTQYTDPQVLDTVLGKILTVEVRRAQAAPVRSYYLWQDEGWQVIDTDSWRRDLARRVPAGLTVSEVEDPDFAVMRVRAKLSRQGHGDASGGTADVALALVKTRLTVKSVAMTPAAGQR